MTISFKAALFALALAGLAGPSLAEEAGRVQLNGKTSSSMPTARGAMRLTRQRRRRHLLHLRGPIAPTGTKPRSNPFLSPCA